MAGFSLGINGGDAGDAFMDAPPAGGSSRSGKGNGSGENPLSSFLNLVGVHIGENKAQSDAINKGTSQTGGTVNPVGTGDTGVSNLNPNPPVYDSKGDYIGSGGNILPSTTSQNQALANTIQAQTPVVPGPTPIHSFLSNVGDAIMGKNDTNTTPGSAQIDGNKDGSYGGGLGKALLKMFGA